MYSTHQAIKNTPSFCLLSYGATCLVATQITVERKEIDFFFLFSRREEKTIYKSYTLEITYEVLPRLYILVYQLRTSPFPPQAKC
jgi:hypothetical protein